MQTTDGRPCAQRKGNAVAASWESSRSHCSLVKAWLKPVLVAQRTDRTVAYMRHHQVHGEGGEVAEGGEGAGRGAGGMGDTREPCINVAGRLLAKGREDTVQQRGVRTEARKDRRHAANEPCVSVFD